MNRFIRFILDVEKTSLSEETPFDVERRWILLHSAERFYDRMLYLFDIVWAVEDGHDKEGSLEKAHNFIVTVEDALMNEDTFPAVVQDLIVDKLNEINSAVNSDCKLIDKKTFEMIEELKYYELKKYICSEEMIEDVNATRALMNEFPQYVILK